MPNKYLGITLTIISGIYWFLIQQIMINLEYFERILPAFILTFIFSYTTYKIFISIFQCIFNSSNLIKRIILRNEYLHGNWVGYYIGESGKIRYVFEEITQTFDDIIITGKAYDENGEVNSRWNSESVNLNEKIGKLVYTYNAEGKSNDADGTGLVKFSFNKKNCFGPNTLEGFFTDLQYGKRREIYEKKLNVKKITKETIISEAKKLYEDHAVVPDT